ncbi:MAG: hypothetical protein QM778_28430 [Myxococcales bacterium]
MNGGRSYEVRRLQNQEEILAFFGEDPIAHQILLEWAPMPIGSYLAIEHAVRGAAAIPGVPAASIMWQGVLASPLWTLAKEYGVMPPRTPVANPRDFMVELARIATAVSAAVSLELNDDQAE